MKPQITDDYVLYKVYNDFCGNLAFDFEGHGYINFHGIVSTGDTIDHSLYLKYLIKNIRNCPYNIEEYRFEPIASNVGDGSVIFERNDEVIKYNMKIDGI